MSSSTLYFIIKCFYKTIKIMPEVPEFTPPPAQEETAHAIEEHPEQEAGTSYVRQILDILIMTLRKDTDKQLQSKRLALEQRIENSRGFEAVYLRQQLRSIAMEQRCRRDPEVRSVYDTWRKAQSRGIKAYEAWKKETEEKYGDGEWRRRILAGEAPKFEFEYTPEEEKSWYKLMRMEVEEGVRNPSMLTHVKEVEDAGGFANWERQQQEQIHKEPGVPEPIQPGDTDGSTTAKIEVIQQELNSISSASQEPEVEQ
jgi:hypothetical protein